jgi:hypothetical protein
VVRNAAQVSRLRRKQVALQLRVAKGCAPTARTLSHLLVENGAKLSPTGQGVVCWGAGAQAGGLPTLNARCSHYNKLQQLQVLHKAGILVPPFMATGIPAEYPALARKLHHAGGRDIVVCLQPEDAARARANGRDYFTKYIPRATEFRVWIYRRRHLGTYEKVLKYPGRFKGVGCNYDNGFAFSLVQEAAIPRAAVDIAARTVDSLGLDFGAVVVLKGKDGKFYVLECNSAPGVEGEGRQAIQALAAKIAKWEKLGFPKRNGDQG